MRLRRAFILDLCLLLGAPVRHAGAWQGPAPAPPRVVAGRLEGRIDLDGRLDEPVWRQAGIIPDLTQKSPHPGEPTRFRTEVRLLVDDENLYVGIACFDPEPERIAVHTMQRDTVDPFGDDFVDLIFDTFGDRRSGYLFEVYPSGAEADGLIAGPGRLSTDWDGVWDVKARRDASGWTAELRIPSRTLHFKTGVDEWGLNLIRHVARERTFLVWSGVSLDSDVLDLATAGRLAGVGGLTQGIGLNLGPYALGRTTRVPAQGERSTVGRGGLDLAYSLTPALTAVATVNTDFAETEVDARQVNLTRFPLFFPEKRPFFLEGSNQFEFAVGLGTDFIPFYSRRVGLVEVDDEGVAVPLDYGGKVLGRAGRFGIAAFDIATGESAAAPRAHLSAARVTFDAGDRLRIGTIATHGDPQQARDNTLAGFDAVWHTHTLFGDKNLTLGSWTARSSGDLPDGRREGWGFRAEYPNDRWNSYLGVNEYGDAFDPALGFLPRPGTRQYDFGNAFQPRPDRQGRFSSIRQAFFETFYRQVDDLSGRAETRRLFVAPFNIETESGEHFEANWVPEYERIEPTDPAFEVAPGVVVTPGAYRFTRYRVEMESSEARPWRLGTTVWLGGFYGGRLTQIADFVGWNVLSGRLQQQLDLENDYGRLPEGDFITRLWQLRNVFAFSPRLLLFGFFQYDSDSRSLGLNARLRWTFRPGSDLFVVWNRNWDHPQLGGRFDLEPQSDQITVKVRLAIRE